MGCPVFFEDGIRKASRDGARQILHSTVSVTLRPHRLGRIPQRATLAQL